MDEYFAALPVTNSRVLCVGGITRAEAEAARDDGLNVDGEGYYIFVADEAAPHQPIRLLAKCLSSVEAEHLSRLLSRQPLSN